jgi:hypothetical protein
MLHRPGQDAVQHGTDGKPKTTHVVMLIHVLRNPDAAGADAIAAKAS